MEIKETEENIGSSSIIEAIEQTTRVVSLITGYTDSDRPTDIGPDEYDEWKNNQDNDSTS